MKTPPLPFRGRREAGRLLDRAVRVVREAARPLFGSPRDLDPLIQTLGSARFVLLGEASHGTQEFYQVRAEITRRLIQEHGFRAVAVEADWPDAARADRYARGSGDDSSAAEALEGFRRFPTWMWRNTVVVEFIEWLRAHNAALPTSDSKTGFFGLDLYSLRTSMEAVIGYLDGVDPEAARRARERYGCFDHFGGDEQRYGFLAGAGLASSCEEEVVGELVELRRNAAELAARDGRTAEDAHFDAEQNARLVMNAEAYYRSMFLEEVSSWNLRDRHMAETLEGLVAHRERRGESSKVIVWAHNSHLGDARATDMGRRGEWNLGQLVRERHPREAVLVGFTTNHGTVTAASDWGATAERKQVRPALPGSYEELFHAVDKPAFFIPLRRGAAPARELNEVRLERAIGVIYRPETERVSHYFRARLPDQFDVVLHFDESRAVEPLERTADWDRGEVPETFPSAV